MLGITATDDVDGAGGDTGTITSDQIKVLNDLITDSGADFKKFLEYMGVDQLGAIPESHFNRAMNALKRKVGK